MPQQSFQRFFTEVQRLFAPLTLAPDPIRFFQALGWDIPALTGSSAGSFTAVLSTITQSVGTVEALVVSPPQTFAEFQAALDQLDTLKQAVQALRAPLVANAAVANALPGRLLNKLLVLYLRTYQPIIYEAFSLLRIIDIETAASVVDVTSNVIIYQSGLLPELRIGRLKDFLRAPADYLEAEYWPDGLPDQTTANTVAERIFPFISRIAFFLGISFQYSHPAVNKPSYLTATEWEELRSIATLLTPLFTTDTGGVSLTMGVGLLPATAFPADGAGVFLAPRGNATFSTRFQDWLITTELSAGAGGIRIHRNKIDSLSDSISPVVRLVASVRPLLKSATPAPAFVIGSPVATRLELGFYSVRVFLSKSEQIDDFGVSLDLQRMRLVLASTDADSFLSKALHSLGTAPVLDFDLSVAWTKRRGLHLSGSGSLETIIALPNAGSSQSALKFGKIALGLRADEKGLALYAATDATIRLGPIVASIERFGLGAALQAVDIGNFGPFDASIAFKAPTGIGIAVDSDALTGGGYLYANPATHQYAGVATLTLNKTINLNARGLLQTQLPAGRDGYSLLLLITATFTPIQLGLGFTLTGLGGLLGVNRATNPDYLRGLVRGGQLDQLLFPADVLDNPAATLALVDAAFPATEGRYVLGLLAKIGWGAPTALLTLEVALLIELPAPVRLAIVGVLETTLPSKNKELLKLRADFLGTLDFGAQQAAFDATLRESHLLDLALTGDLAFRFYQGNTPLFVVTAGGFHPAFQPPAGAALTGLRRLTLAMAHSGLRLTLTSYFAVTANTVQFGSYLALYYAIARGLHVEGNFGFDVLFQLSPFQVQAHLEAGVAIKAGSHELLSLHLSLDVTGPGPWHIWGSASFKIWFVRIPIELDVSIGRGRTEPALPAADVQALLVTALDAAASWAVEVPPTVLPGGVVLRPVSTTAAPFFLDPRGALALRQRVAPLGVRLTKYGNSPLAAAGQRFDLTELTVGDTRHPVASDQGVAVVRDFFAPDQFQQLTDAQKLSLPSFQLLPCGLRLARLSGLVAATRATLRVVEYEHKLLDGTSGGATSAKLKVAATTYRQLARGGALGQQVHAAQPSARAPQAVSWAEDAYVVVHAATLEVYDPVGHARFATQLEAEQYRQALVAATPALAGEVLVMPEYQLALA